MIYFNLFMFGAVKFSFFAYYTIQIGSTVEVILFSVALTDRINVLRKEKEIAQTKTIEMQKNLTTTLEKKVEERTKDLNNAKTFIETIIEKSPIAIHVTDIEGKITLENTAMRHIVNPNNTPLVGMNIHDINLHNSDEFIKIYDNALKGIPYHETNKSVVSPATDKKNYYNIIITPLYESSKKHIESILTFYYDNTEKAIAERELKRALKQISGDLILAEQIQGNYISSDYKEIKDVNIDVHFEPMIEIGGDIYDAYQVSEDIFRVFIADATGHGVQAALTTMIIKTEYDRIKLFELPVNRVLEILNHTYIRRYATIKSYFTCAIIDINIKEKTIQFTSAGHLDQIFIKNNKVEMINTEGPLVGILEDAEFFLNSLTYNTGDKVLLYTDGIVEVLSENYEIYGMTPLIKCIQNNSKKPIPEIFTSILDDLKRFQGKVPTTDDRTIIGITL